MRLCGTDPALGSTLTGIANGRLITVTVISNSAPKHPSVPLRGLPSPTFIKLAKKAGARFSFGTNNADRNVGDLDYCLQMVRECELTWQDMFVPRPDGQKPAQVKHAR